MVDLLIMLGVFAAAFVIGYFLISRVPSLLHTPLMSMTNAISAVTVLGALMVFAVKTDLLEGTLGALALVMAMFNVVGGFAITYRMLKLFKKSGPSDR
jgi:NAD(P) transhydrogenase subunit alpha